MINKELSDALSALILETGAAKVGQVAVDDIVFDPVFRDICAANSCGKYGKCHMCPPDVGDIHALIAEAQSYECALVFQNVYPLEDSFDFEGMVTAKDHFRAITVTLRRHLIDHKIENALLLGAGGCGVCEKCTKEENLPCKAPHLAIAGLEAYGIHVSKLTAAADMKYINGADTVTYFGAILLK